MDTNWCLYCDCHFDGMGPFCSFECQNKSGPSFLDRGLPELLSDDDDSLVYHHVKDTQSHSHWWSTDNFAGISAWAAEIPSHTSHAKTPSASRLPKLLRSNKRPAPPALCLTIPKSLSPCSQSRPIRTKPLSGSTSRTSLDTESMGKTSVSGNTDSTLATPTSALAVPIRPSSKDRSLFGSIATHIHSISPFLKSRTSHDCHLLSPSTAKQYDSYAYSP